MTKDPQPSTFAARLAELHAAINENWAGLHERVLYDDAVAARDEFLGKQTEAILALVEAAGRFQRAAYRWQGLENRRMAGKTVPIDEFSSGAMEIRVADGQLSAALEALNG